MKCRATSSPIDQVEAVCAVMSYFQDERPLKGMTGLADWRLGGSLSKHILDDRIDGRFGDVLMFPIGHRLQVNRALMVGLGPKTKYNFESFSVCVRRIMDTLYKLRINDFTMALPGLDGTNIDITMAANRFCEAVAIRFRDDPTLYAHLNITVVADSDHLKKLNPVFTKFEKKVREELGTQ